MGREAGRRRPAWRVNGWAPIYRTSEGKHRRHHLVLAVEVGEADLGGVLERAVGLAPRPGTHAGRSCTAVLRRVPTGHAITARRPANLPARQLPQV